MHSVNESTNSFVMRLMSRWEKVLIFAIIVAIISILVIKQAVSQGDASDSEKFLSHRNVQRYPNCTITKSKCTHCSVAGSEDHKKSACSYKD